MKATVCGVFLCLVGLGAALYTSEDDVVMLDSSNFDREVLQSNDVWLVEFFAPWCGHCQHLAPEWKKAATALKGIAKVGAADMDKDAAVGGPYNIRGYPTIKIFGGNKNLPTDYNGARNAETIVDAAKSAVEAMANPSAGSDVVELTDSNFASTVLQSDDMWLVDFFAPWCGHCKNLAPAWEQAAVDLKGKVKVGKFDATVNPIMPSRYDVRGYPTITMFPKGAKDKSVNYDGGRAASDIVQWALNKLEEKVEPTPGTESPPKNIEL